MTETSMTRSARKGYMIPKKFITHSVLKVSTGYPTILWLDRS